MSDEQKKDLQGMSDTGFTELSDEVLDAIAGGYIYHDPGDSAQHRAETFYVLDNTGDIIMRLDDLGNAKHWAGNLRTSKKVIGVDEFNQLRRSHGIS